MLDAGRPTDNGNLIPRTSIPSQAEMNAFEEWERVEGFHEFLVRHLLLGFEHEQGPAERAKPLAVWGNLGVAGQPDTSRPEPTPTGGFGEFAEWNHPIWGFFARYRQTDLRDLGRTDILARTKSAEDLRPGDREDFWNYVIYFTQRGSPDVGNANRRAEWLTWPVDHRQWLTWPFDPGQRRHYFIEKRINGQVVKVWLKWLIPMLMRTKSEVVDGARVPKPWRPRQEIWRGLPQPPAPDPFPNAYLGTSNEWVDLKFLKQIVKPDTIVERADW